jgi:hypothetical protein
LFCEIHAKGLLSRLGTGNLCDSAPNVRAKAHRGSVVKVLRVATIVTF